MKTLLMVLSLIPAAVTPIRAQSIDSLWSRQFNSANSGSDQYPLVAIDPEGNVVITCMSYDATGIGSNYDWVTFKYRISGDSVGADIVSGASGSNDYPNAIATDFIGNIYVVGRSGSPAQGARASLVVYDSSVDLQWSIDYDGDGNL